MSLPPYYVDELPIVEFKNGNAWLQLASGAGPKLVVPRSVWRHFLQGNILQLNDIEAIEQATRTVVSMEKSKPTKRGKRK